MKNTSHVQHLLQWLTALMLGVCAWSLCVSATAQPPEPSKETAASDATPQSQPAAKPEPRPLPEFELINSDGSKVTRESLRGQQWVAGFFFTRCQGPCPQLIAAMKKLQKETGVTLVAITVDPENDTPDVLRNYAAALVGTEPVSPDHPDAKWYWLSGKKSDIFRLIHLGFLMPAFDNDRPIPGAEVAHSNNLMHVDEQGQVWGKYLGTDDAAQALLRRIIQGDAPRGQLMPGVTMPKSAPKAPSRKTDVIVDTPVPGLTFTRPEDSESDEPPAEHAPAVPAWIMNLPAVNAGLNGLATCLLLLGYVLIKSGRREAHKWVMLACFGVSVVFLVSYLTYHYFAGHKPFPGTGTIKTVYLLILLTHIVLAATVPVLAITTIVQGLREKWISHRWWAKLTFPIWLYVSITGVVIYVMLYRLPMG